MTVRFIEDPEVQTALEEAARVACERLDEVFPGRDAGGIGSNFQGTLEAVLSYMLRGHDPLAQTKRYRTALPKLVLDDESFGDPRATGEMFVVTAVRRGDWDAARHRFTEQTVVLDWSGRRFVPLGSEEIDPFTSYDAAVAGAVEYLKRLGDDSAAQRLAVRAVVAAEPGYTLKQ